jgi:CDP-glycerol glycerophosphotransferase
LPVRDGAPYLDEALRSLAEQTHEDLEVVVVDDGSLDASGEIARDWEKPGVA